MSGSNTGANKYNYFPTYFLHQIEEWVHNEVCVGAGCLYAVWILKFRCIARHKLWGLQKCKIHVALSRGVSYSVSFLNLRLKIKYQLKLPWVNFILQCLELSYLKLNWASSFSGPALADVGEAMKELSEVKDSLDMEVKQNFIDPLQNLHDKDLREIQVLS